MDWQGEILRSSTLADDTSSGSSTVMAARAGLAVTLLLLSAMPCSKSLTFLYLSPDVPFPIFPSVCSSLISDVFNYQE